MSSRLVEGATSSSQDPAEQNAVQQHKRMIYMLYVISGALLLLTCFVGYRLRVASKEVTKQIDSKNALLRSEELKKGQQMLNKPGVGNINLDGTKALTKSEGKNPAAFPNFTPVKLIFQANKRTLALDILRTPPPSGVRCEHCLAMQGQKECMPLMATEHCLALFAMGPRAGTRCASCRVGTPPASTSSPNRP